MTKLDDLCFSVFRAGFYEKDPEPLVREKWEEWPGFQKMAIRQVRAVLADLRTPSPAMVEAGVTYRLRTTISGGNNWPTDTAALWTAMVDAILNETPA